GERRARLSRRRESRRRRLRVRARPRGERDPAADARAGLARFETDCATRAWRTATVPPSRTSGGDRAVLQRSPHDWNHQPTLSLRRKPESIAAGAATLRHLRRCPCVWIPAFAGMTPKIIQAVCLI